MSIAPFPHQYSVTIEGGSLAAGPRAPIAVGSPPQFGGSETVWSPEELLVGATVLCLQTTFEAYARKYQLPPVHWRAAGTGILDKAKGGPLFSRIEIRVDLDVPAGAADQARQLLETAEKNCIISRSLNAPVTLEIVIHETEVRAAG